MSYVMNADAIVVGSGLAGLVAATEIAEAGKSVVVVDQESEPNLGGQAWWSLGGLFLVDSPEQRRLGIRDSRDLAWQDWLGTAGFDRDEDAWPARWAQAYVDWASGEKRSWLRELGIRFFPVVGWAERGGGLATGHGNSVPRFHIVWGSGPGVVEPFIRRARAAEADGRLMFMFRHRVTGIERSAGRVAGVFGDVLAPDESPRGVPTNRDAIRSFRVEAPNIVIAAGGLGANLDLVRQNWPERLGPSPRRLLVGVPDYVDGSMLAPAEAAGARLINTDRMWHYCEGIRNYEPIWSRHGIRILPGPSSLWLDAAGNRLPAPCFPGFDTLATLRQIGTTGHDYSWFILTARIIEKEFALSGSEQNPDLTSKSIRRVLGRLKPGPPGPVQAFVERGADFVRADTLDRLVERMNRLTDEPRLDPGEVLRQVRARDAEIGNVFTKDAQIAAIRNARAYLGDKLIRVARPHPLLDARSGPLIGVRLNILTRKTLGGIETDLDGRVQSGDGNPVPGLWAAGEAAGFGGGGMHGYRSLEGSFLGGCLFSGRAVGRSLARG